MDWRDQHHQYEMQSPGPSTHYDFPNYEEPDDYQWLPKFQPNINTIHATLRRFRRDFTTPEDEQAMEIVNTMRMNRTLMEDTPQSEQQRKEAVRQMTQCLGMKRRVHQTLTNTMAVSQRRKRKNWWQDLKSRATSKYAQLRERLSVAFELWHSTLRTIEGRFGSGYASYFKFFRWLFVLNSFTAILAFVFVVLPQIMYDVNHNSASLDRSFNFLDIFTGNGYLADTVLFYGHYTDQTINLSGGPTYAMPTAYFTVMTIIYGVSFGVLSVSTASSYKRSFIQTAGGLQNAYANRIFCGWDFGIATEEAATLKSSAIYREISELLSEQKLNARDEETFCSKFQTWTIQVVCHLMILIVNALVGWGLWELLQHFNDGHDIVIIAIFVNLIILVLPTVYSLISMYEQYDSPRTRLLITLLRTYVLNVVVVGVILVYFLHKAEPGTCWQTFLAEEMYRLIIFDFLFAIILTPLFEVLTYYTRQILKLEHNKLEFNIAKHTMLLIFNQALLWSGMFYSPLLPLLVAAKMLIIWYLRELILSWLYGPPQTSWRAAQTQTWFKIITLLTNLMIIIVHIYTLKNVTNSTCGPFKGYDYIYEIITSNFNNTNWFFGCLLFITRPGCVAFIMIFLLVCVYYTRELAMIEKMRVVLLREMLAVQARDKKYFIDSIRRLTGQEYKFRDSRFMEFGTRRRHSQRPPQPNWQREDFYEEPVENPRNHSIQSAHSVRPPQPNWQREEFYEEPVQNPSYHSIQSAHSVESQMNGHEQLVDAIVEDRLSKYV